MERIGVAAVVEGLSEFIGDMDKMDDAIRKLIAPTNILGSTFEGLGNIFSNIGSFVASTLAHAFGEILADAVQWVTTQIKELISATIDAAGEFQKLSLRLNTLNFAEAAEQADSYAEAQEMATEATKEQLTWLQRLAAQTPYDNTDISNIYTLARGYSFTDQEARGLTETIIDFTSGMGLGNAEITRIIKNFGQMRQLGKLTQRDLNDLATGAFVPVNKILGEMRVKTGLAGDEFDKFRQTAEGVELFMQTFTEMVDNEFGGAAERMARTFGAATDNVKDFVKSVVGLNIVKPILDVLGGRVADFMDELTSEDRWNAIVGVASRIGTSMSGIVGDILDLAPSAEGMADAVVSALEGISDWLDSHREDIIAFVEEAARWFREELLPAIQAVWDLLFGSSGEPGAIQAFGDYLMNDLMPFIQQEVLPGLSDLFEAITGTKLGKQEPSGSPDDRDEKKKEEPTALENIVGAVAAISTALPSILALFGAIGTAILVAFGGTETQTFAEFITNNLIPAIQALTMWISDNQEVVGMFVRTLLLMEGLAIIVGFVFTLIAGLISLVAAFALLWVVQSIFTQLQIGIEVFVAYFTGVGNAIAIVLWFIFTSFMAWKENVIRTFNEVMEAIKEKDWPGAGKALVDGVKSGFTSAWHSFMATINSLAQNALNSFKGMFKIKSPSAVMADVGANIVEGLAKGVRESTGVAVSAMSKVSAAMIAAPQMAYTNATTAPSQNTYQTENNFNLNVNSHARTEPLVSDFNLMRSMVGG